MGLQLMFPANSVRKLSVMFSFTTLMFTLILFIKSQLGFEAIEPSVAWNKGFNSNAL